MAPPEVPKTLFQALNNTIRVYGAALIFSLLVILFIPSWLRWIGFYAGSALFLTFILAPFVEDWRPKSRVPPNGKAIFITGCDSGFGQKLAEKLDDLGLHVFAGCLFPEGEGAKELKRSASSKLHIVALDVTSEESVEKAHKYVTQKLKDNKLWAVVNNAGLNEGGELLWTNTDIIQRVIDVNTMGVVRVTKAFLPLLMKFKGRVVTVASAAGRYTYPGLVAYCMSKQATVSFCDGLRLEMYRFGVKVVTIEPYMYKTPITKEETVTNYISRAWDKAPKEIKELLPTNYIERYKKSAVKFLHYSISDKPQQVVDCLEEAIMAMHPKYAYNPGTFFSRLACWVMRRLPKPLADFALFNQVSFSLSPKTST